MGARGPAGAVGARAPRVLLIIDVINDFTFEEGAATLAAAIGVAGCIRRLKRAARRAGVPTVYVNDNFGRWRSDFRSLVAHCLRRAARGRPVVRLLRPDHRDYFILKPKHSAFFSTPLDLLLEHLGARTLILTGLLADSCILFTAQDAHLRGYRVVVPSDCVAARRAEDHRRAMAQLRRGMDADVRPAAELLRTSLGKPAARVSRGAAR
jgi:nicotinamidase-related amidase